MAKTLTVSSISQLDRKSTKHKFTVALGSDIITQYVVNYGYRFDTSFNIASCTLGLVNNQGIFSEGGAREIHLGDKVVINESFYGTADEFTNFTGYVRQRRKQKSGGSNIMSITCLDFLVKLEDTDIENYFESTKLSVIGETLTPNYLDVPNDHLAQIYDFANDSIAKKPPPVIRVHELNTGLIAELDSGYQIYYEQGQVKMGTAFAPKILRLEASYYHYPATLHIEDIIQDLIAKHVDGYGDYLFGEDSEADVIANHLTETYYNMESTAIDTMIPNLASQNITISTDLTVAAEAGDIFITVRDTSGFPDSDTGDINGEAFTWATKTGTTILNGTVTSAHAIGSYVNYKADYDAGRVWYLSYSNLTTDLDPLTDFTTPGASIDYVDKRQGRIILNTAINVFSTSVTCNVDYTFKTIQATGIRISDINFSFRNTKSRLDALKSLKELLAPNYVFQTLGNEKIWGRFLSQKAIEDFTLKCKLVLDYGEDTSIFTRTKFYGENENPTNVTWQPGVGTELTGEITTTPVNNQPLTWMRKEGAWQVYSAPGIKRILNSPVPRIRVNGVLINDELHEVLWQPLLQNKVKAQKEKRAWTYYYQWQFAHQNIDRNHVIRVYDADGSPNEVFSQITPGQTGMNYEAGIMTVGPLYDTIGDDPVLEWERASTASYWIHWSRGDLEIDFEKGEFKIHTRIISDAAKDQVSVTGDFTYQSVVEGIENADFILDGNWGTQAQTVFWAKPAAGFVFLRLDLGDLFDIEIIDLVSGFFRPEENSKIRLDMTNTYTLEFSTDNVIWEAVCPEARKFRLASGEAKSFDLEDLGENFQARYIQIVVDDMSKIPYRGGCWIVAFTELACYANTILVGEAKLTPWTELSAASTNGDGTINVDDTATFPSSGNGYIGNNAFSYTDKTATTFTGCTGVTTNLADTRVSQELQSEGADTWLTAACTADAGILTVDSTTDFAAKGTAYVEGDAFAYTALTPTTFTGCTGLTAHLKFAAVVQSPLVYDSAYLLKIKDRVYKDIAVNFHLSTQSKVNKRAYNWMREFIKDHSKCTAQTTYGPHYRPGMTVRVIDASNNIDTRMFINAVQVSSSSGGHPCILTLAKYP